MCCVPNSVRDAYQAPVATRPATGNATGTTQYVKRFVVVTSACDHRSLVLSSRPRREVIGIRSSPPTLSVHPCAYVHVMIIILLSVHMRQCDVAGILAYIRTHTYHVSYYIPPTRPRCVRAEESPPVTGSEDAISGGVYINNIVLVAHRRCYDHSTRVRECARPRRERFERVVVRDGRAGGRTDGGRLQFRVRAM